MTDPTLAFPLPMRCIVGTVWPAPRGETGRGQGAAHSRCMPALRRKCRHISGIPKHPLLYPRRPALHACTRRLTWVRTAGDAGVLVESLCLALTLQLSEQWLTGLWLRVVRTGAGEPHRPAWQ